uniref:Uncharacterized protein n=1 Tax=Anguilla anguilla TaxID=7936 RepID=A0A0E9P868_ANGAN
MVIIRGILFICLMDFEEQQSGSV